MADRFFPNEMHDFVPEKAEAAEGKAQDSLTKFLQLPYINFEEKIMKSAMELKQTIVKETWVAMGRRVRDYSLYTGALGTALLLFRAFQVKGDMNDLALCLEITSACDAASRSSGRVTFMCGKAGVYALGAVAAMHMGNEQLCSHYLAQFKEIKLPNDLPDELLYGKAGYLCACLFINKNIREGIISSSKMRSVVDEVVRSGRKMAKGGCPLMYEWHGKKYWGAAHGLAGVMNVLMDMELGPNEQEGVKSTLGYMIKNRFPSGNYPSSERSDSDRLVHWCHGAPGLALTLTKAAKVFNCEEFQQAAMDAAEVVWERGLLKRVGLCHGISGNAYVFLSLYRLTGDVKYLYKAKAFACFLHDRAQALISEGIMHGGDCPYSLFEGLAGMAYLFLDMSDPLGARFPGYEL